MKQKKVIIDTSIWIEYFRGNSQNEGFIEKGLSEGSIYITGSIVSELLQGVKTQKEYDILSKCIEAIPFINCEYKDWITAGSISLNLRKKGITVPLTDIVIASVAMRINAKIYTLDKHFERIDGIDLLKS